jgi:hypothetical protein
MDKKIMITQLNINQQKMVGGAGSHEAMCIASFGALGALGGFIGGGIATAGLGMGPGALWGLGLGTQVGSAICLE